MKNCPRAREIALSFFVGVHPMTFDELLTFVLTPAAQIALIIGLAELAKKSGLPTRWIPLLDLVLGLLSGILVFGILLGNGIAQSIPVGLALGLSACGLFSGIKNVTHVDK